MTTSLISGSLLPLMHSTVSATIQAATCQHRQVTPRRSIPPHNRRNITSSRGSEHNTYPRHQLSSVTDILRRIRTDQTLVRQVQPRLAIRMSRQATAPTGADETYTVSTTVLSPQPAGGEETLTLLQVQVMPPTLTYLTLQLISHSLCHIRTLHITQPRSCFINNTTHGGKN